MQTNLNPEELNAQFRLAEQGDSNAQYQMGNYYVNLASDAENYSEMYDKARDWYYKSAKQGNLKAQNALGGYHYRVEIKSVFTGLRKRQMVVCQ